MRKIGFINFIGFKSALASQPPASASVAFEDGVIDSRNAFE
jgi:hypothetical protein